MKLKRKDNLLWFSVLVFWSMAGAPSVSGADLIVSANDGKYVRVLGRDTYPEGIRPDTLTLLDASRFPPEVKATVNVEHTIIGPPQAVATTPDGKLAIVGAPTRSGINAAKNE